MEIVERWKWDTNSILRLSNSPTNLLASWSPVVKAFVVYNEPKQCLSFHSLVDYSSVYSNVEVIAPSKLTGAPIMRWNSGASLAALFSSYLLLLHFEKPSNGLKVNLELKTKTRITLPKNHTMVQWINDRFLVSWNKSHLCILDASISDISFELETPISSITSFKHPETGDPTVVCASERLVQFINISTLATTKHLLDDPLSSIVYNGSGTILSFKSTPANMWPTSETALEMNPISPLASLLSIGAQHAAIASSSPNTTLISLGVVPPYETRRLLWNAKFSAPSSIDHLTYSTGAQRLYYCDSTSPTIYCCDINPTDSDQLECERLNLESPSARILGLLVCRHNEVPTGKLPNADDGFHMFALLGERVDNNLNFALPSHREYINLEIVDIKLGINPIATTSKPVASLLSAGRGSGERQENKSLFMTDLKAQLLQMAMEDAQVEEEELIVPNTTLPDLNNGASHELSTISQQMAILMSKMDSMLASQQILETRLDELSMEVRSLRSREDRRQKD